MTAVTNAEQNPTGFVREILIAESAGVEMHHLDDAVLVVDVGIAGDRYAAGKGHYSPQWHVDRQVTLIEQEVIHAIGDALGQEVNGMDMRRNVVTERIRIKDLIDHYFFIGEALLFGGRENVPCRYLERLIDKPVFELLVGRSGVNCRIVRGGHIHPGDAVRVARADEVLDE